MRKVISIIAVFALVFSFAGFANAFTKMDVCNYTNGDTSGDYYDGLCTKDGKENEKDFKSTSKKSIEKVEKNEKVEKKVHELNHTKKVTLKSFFEDIINSLRIKLAERDEEIKVLKNTLKNKEYLISKLEANEKRLKNEIRVKTDLLNWEKENRKIEKKYEKEIKKEIEESIAEKIKRINAKKRLKY